MESGVFDELLYRVKGPVDWPSVTSMDAFSRRAILSNLALDCVILTPKAITADVRRHCDFCGPLQSDNNWLVWAVAEFGAFCIA